MDIRSIDVESLRARIGYVNQEPSLFDRSVAENIAYGCQDATQAQIEDAAKRAHAHDFIEAFPDGYDTLVGPGGQNISGGTNFTLWAVYSRINVADFVPRQLQAKSRGLRLLESLCGSRIFYFLTNVPTGWTMRVSGFCKSR